MNWFFSIKTEHSADQNHKKIKKFYLLFWYQLNPVNPVKITPIFASNVNIRVIIEGEYNLKCEIWNVKFFFPPEGCHRAACQNPALDWKSAGLHSAQVPADALRLPIQEDTTHTGKIHHRRPRRLPPTHKTQMAGYQVPPKRLCYKICYNRLPQAEVCMYAPRDYECPARPIHRPYQP